MAVLLDGKVGPEYSTEEFEEILKEGERRFKNKIPPGYKDSEKSNDDQYGDYIVWKETLDYAKEKSKSIIFVSSDRKDDWYLKSNGLCYGPLPALIKEFYEYTGQTIYLYSLEQFLFHVKEKKILEISHESLEEVKEIANAARESDFGASYFTSHSGILESARKLSDSCQSSSYGITSPLDAVTGTARKIASITESVDRLGQIVPNMSSTSSTLQDLLKSNSTKPNDTI